MQKVVERAGRHPEMRRQPAVEGVGHLVEVVADAPQFGEQRGIDPVDGRLGYFDRDATAQNSSLAIGSDLETELHGGE